MKVSTDQIFDFIKENRSHFDRIIKECLDVSFLVCNARLERFTKRLFEETFQRLLPTAFVLQTGYWPYYNYHTQICVCDRFAIDCLTCKDYERGFCLCCIDYFRQYPEALRRGRNKFRHNLDYIIQVRNVTEDMLPPGVYLSIEIKAEFKRLKPKRRSIYAFTETFYLNYRFTVLGSTHPPKSDYIMPRSPHLKLLAMEGLSFRDGYKFPSYLDEDHLIPIESMMPFTFTTKPLDPTTSRYVDVIERKIWPSKMVPLRVTVCQVSDKCNWYKLYTRLKCRDLLNSSLALFFYLMNRPTWREHEELLKCVEVMFRHIGITENELQHSYLFKCMYSICMLHEFGYN